MTFNTFSTWHKLWNTILKQRGPACLPEKCFLPLYNMVSAVEKKSNFLLSVFKGFNFPLEELYLLHRCNNFPTDWLCCCYLCNSHTYSKVALTHTEHYISQHCMIYLWWHPQSFICSIRIMIYFSSAFCTDIYFSNVNCIFLLVSEKQ